ncbi:MAG TPA: hypothetical protein PLL95_09975 [Anaerolineales bacterium]|nr:hypothetical protein [Anaerolineales bacterium]
MTYNSNKSDAIQIIKGLGAETPDPKLKDKLMLFGQFIGDWEIESEWFLPNGLRPKGKGEIHFGWILSGTAIQDVWSGVVENPPQGFPSTGFGTTIRFYDPTIDALRIIWIAPIGNIIQTFVARAVGDEIVLEGRTVDEKFPERWILSEITPISFHWRSVESYDNEKTWQVTQKVVARRVSQVESESSQVTPMHPESSD